MLILSYKLPARMLLTNQYSTLRLRRSGKNSYESYDLDTKELGVLSDAEVMELHRRPDVTVDTAFGIEDQSANRVRRGSIKYRGQLTPDQVEELDFRKALVRPIKVLEDEGHKITEPFLNLPEIREFIRTEARKTFTARPISTTLRGGLVRLVACMPAGRTLKDYYYRVFSREDDDDGDQPWEPNEIALIDQTWLRGNRTTQRIDTALLELMTQARDRVLDPKQRTCLSRN